MNKKTLLSSLAVLVGLLFLAIVSIYASRTAQHLPTWFPGYDTALDRVHTKHAIAAFLLAIAAFVFAWFQGGKKPTETPVRPN